MFDVVEWMAANEIYGGESGTRTELGGGGLSPEDRSRGGRSAEAICCERSRIEKGVSVRVARHFGQAFLSLAIRFALNWTPTDEDEKKCTYPRLNPVIETGNSDDSASPIQRRWNVPTDASNLSRRGLFGAAQVVSARQWP